MADPAMSAARAVDQLTDEPLPGLPMTSVDRIEDDLLSEGRQVHPYWWAGSRSSLETTIQGLIAQADAYAKRVQELEAESAEWQRLFEAAERLCARCGRDLEQISRRVDL